MKIKFNFRDKIRQFADSDNRLTLKASVDVDTLVETAFLSDELEVELDELLQENRIIGHLWTIDDVREVRPQLTENQAWEVLRECKDRLDSQVGLNWQQIEDVADDLFGAATQRLVRFSEFVEQYNDFDAEQSFIDLLGDAMHWCRINDANFEELLAEAKTVFQTEIQA